MKIRVYLATTQGAILLEGISRESAPQAAIRIPRTTQTLSVSGGYDTFVHQSSGAAEGALGLFDEGGFRLDVSAEAADGESWQLGLFVARELKELGELAAPDDPYDEVWWLTGEVDNNLNVYSVDHLADKVRAAATDIAAIVKLGKPVTLFVPKGNVDSVNRAELPYGVRVVGVSHTSDVLEGVPHTTSASTLELSDQVAPKVPWPERSARGHNAAIGTVRLTSAVAVVGAGLLALAAVLAFLFGADLFDREPSTPITVDITSTYPQPSVSPSKPEANR